MAFAASAVLSPAPPINDPWTHYAHLRLALREPARLLDPWDRPGFTLLYAAPAALGLTAARLGSVLPSALALVGTMRAARALGLARPWLAGLVLVAQYDFFGQASSTMTELPFAAALALALWGWAEERPWIVAAAAGWCAVTRAEGVLFAALFALALARRRRPGPALAVFAPLAAWGLAGALAFHDALWFLHARAYGGLVAPRLELRQLAESWFYRALRDCQPPVLMLLEVAGAGVALAGRRRSALRVALLPVLASFLVLTFVRIGATDAWRDSRYLVAIAPALAVLGAAGLEAALAAFPLLAPPALLALAAVGAARALLWAWRPALQGIPWAAGVAYAALLAAASLLWAARPRLSPRVALGLLLALPLASSPPGAFSRHRLDLAPPGTAWPPGPPPAATRASASPGWGAPRPPASGS